MTSPIELNLNLFSPKQIGNFRSSSVPMVAVCFASPPPAAFCGPWPWGMWSTARPLSSTARCWWPPKVENCRWWMWLEKSAPPSCLGKSFHRRWHGKPIKTCGLQWDAEIIMCTVSSSRSQRGKNLKSGVAAKQNLRVGIFGWIYQAWGCKGSFFLQIFC